MSRFYVMLFLFSMIHTVHASNKHQLRSLTINTTGLDDVCCDPQLFVSRGFFNRAELLAFAAMSDVHLTRDDFELRYGSLHYEYNLIKPQLNDKAKKYADASLKSLKELLDNFR